MCFALGIVKKIVVLGLRRIVVFSFPFVYVCSDVCVCMNWLVSSWLCEWESDSVSQLVAKSKLQIFMVPENREFSYEVDECQRDGHVCVTWGVYRYKDNVLSYIYSYIYLYIYIYQCTLSTVSNSAQYIYSICLVVVTSIKCSIGRAKYINKTNGWIKQQDNSSSLLLVSWFWQSSGVHILHIRFPKRKNNRMKILF